MSFFAFLRFAFCNFRMEILPPLVVEIPTDTKTKPGWVHGIVRRPKTVTVVLVDVIILDVEAAFLQQHVGIDADKGIAANLDAVLRVLCGEHAEHGGIVGGVVAGEEGKVAADFALHHLRHDEGEVEIGVGVEGGQGQDVLMG